MRVLVFGEFDRRKFENALNGVEWISFVSGATPRRRGYSEESSAILRAARFIEEVNAGIGIEAHLPHSSAIVFVCDAMLPTTLPEPVASLLGEFYDMTRWDLVFSMGDIPEDDVLRMAGVLERCIRCGSEYMVAEVINRLTGAE